MLFLIEDVSFTGLHTVSEKYGSISNKAMWATSSRGEKAMTHHLIDAMTKLTNLDDNVDRKETDRHDDFDDQDVWGVESADEQDLDQMVTVDEIVDEVYKLQLSLIFNHQDLFKPL